jgi:uncharacterized protein YfaS (alpha-2-macroglobulin family)
MAYYGVLQTDAQGRAHAQFTMPDDLTTWRVMAVALDGDAAHFVTGDRTFISTQPLIANPLLPQFARPGDRFQLGLSIANQTGASGALDLVLKLSGALAFAQGDPHAQSATETAQTGMQAFRFPVVAGTPAATLVEASSSLGSQRDAFRVPFTTSDRTVTESVIESGVSTGHAEIPMNVSAGSNWRSIRQRPLQRICRLCFRTGAVTAALEHLWAPRRAIRSRRPVPSTRCSSRARTPCVLMRAPFRRASDS